MTKNIDNATKNAIRGITFGGSMGFDILQRFNTVAEGLPLPGTMDYSKGAAIILPPTQDRLLGAGKSKPEIATSQRFVVRLDASEGDANKLKVTLVGLFGSEVMSSCCDPIYADGKLHYDVGIQLKLSQKAVDLAQQVNTRLRIPTVV